MWAPWGVAAPSPAIRRHSVLVSLEETPGSVGWPGLPRFMSPAESIWESVVPVCHGITLCTASSLPRIPEISSDCRHPQTPALTPPLGGGPDPRPPSPPCFPRHPVTRGGLSHPSGDTDIVKTSLIDSHCEYSVPAQPEEGPMGLQAGAPWVHGLDATHCLGDGGHCPHRSLDCPPPSLAVLLPRPQGRWMRTSLWL